MCACMSVFYLVITMRADSELMVITKSKNLIEYVFGISEKSPKKFRLNLTNRIINLSLEVLEMLVMATETMLTLSENERQKRRNFQHDALAKLRILDALALVAVEQGCILPKQYENLTKLISECINLTGAWINSDRKRTASMGI